MTPYREQTIDQLKIECRQKDKEIDRLRALNEETITVLQSIVEININKTIAMEKAEIFLRKYIK